MIGLRALRVLTTTLLAACGAAPPVAGNGGGSHAGPVSVLEVRLKPMVPCANDGAGERAVIDATETLLRASDDADPLRLELAYTNITAVGDFTRNPYAARHTPGPADRASDGRSTTTLTLYAVDHVVRCSVSVLWRTEPDTLLILGRETTIVCLE